MRRTAISPAEPTSRTWLLRLTVLLGALLALAALGFAGGEIQQKKRPRGSDVTSLPRDVREALQQAERIYAAPLTGARWSRVVQLRGSGHILFQVQGVNGRGNKVEIEITRAGRIIEVEEHG